MSTNDAATHAAQYRKLSFGWTTVERRDIEEAFIAGWNEALSSVAAELPALTEGVDRVATAGWPEDARGTYSLAIEEAQEAIREFGGGSGE